MPTGRRIQRAVVAAATVAAVSGCVDEPSGPRPTSPVEVPCPTTAAEVSAVLGTTAIDVGQGQLGNRCVFAVLPPPSPSGSAVAEQLHSLYPAQITVRVAQDPYAELADLLAPEPGESCAPAGPEAWTECVAYRRERVIVSVPAPSPPGAQWRVQLEHFTVYITLGGWHGDLTAAAKQLAAAIVA